jgi:hypothetical protein
MPDDTHDDLIDTARFRALLGEPVEEVDGECFRALLPQLSPPQQRETPHDLWVDEVVCRFRQRYAIPVIAVSEGSVTKLLVFDAPAEGLEAAYDFLCNCIRQSERTRPGVQQGNGTFFSPAASAWQMQYLLREEQTGNVTLRKYGRCVLPDPLVLVPLDVDVRPWAIFPWSSPAATPVEGEQNADTCQGEQFVSDYWREIREIRGCVEEEETQQRTAKRLEEVQGAVRSIGIVGGDEVTEADVRRSVEREIRTERFECEHSLDARISEIVRRFRQDFPDVPFMVELVRFTANFYIFDIPVSVRDEVCDCLYNCARQAALVERADVLLSSTDLYSPRVASADFEVGLVEVFSPAESPWYMQQLLREEQAGNMTLQKYGRCVFPDPPVLAWTEEVRDADAFDETEDW